MTAKRPKILAVDDNPSNLDDLLIHLDGIYDLTCVPSGEKALKLAPKVKPDLVLLDIEMPEMDGFETLKTLRLLPCMAGIPVIFLTATGDTAVEAKALREGAADFLAKPFDKEILLHRLHLHLTHAQYQRDLEQQVSELEDSLVISFAALIENRNTASVLNAKRVSDFVRVLGEALLQRGADELTPEALELMVRAAPLHDIGKIGLKDNILLDPARPLPPEKMNAVRRHTTFGARVLNDIHRRSPSQRYLYTACEMALTHHEHWDGTGYPSGQSGLQIPLSGRLMAIADSLDAMLSPRPWRKELPPEEARQAIVEGKGTLYDPQIVEIFDAVFEQLMETT